MSVVMEIDGTAHKVSEGTGRREATGFSRGE